MSPLLGGTRHRSRKCSWCDRAWPDRKDYELCPMCEEQTEQSITPAMEDADATALAAEARFGWWLWHEGRL